MNDGPQRSRSPAATKAVPPRASARRRAPISPRAEARISAIPAGSAPKSDSIDHDAAEHSLFSDSPSTSRASSISIPGGKASPHLDRESPSHASNQKSAGSLNAMTPTGSGGQRASLGCGENPCVISALSPARLAARPNSIGRSRCDMKQAKPLLEKCILRRDTARSTSPERLLTASRMSCKPHRGSPTSPRP